MLLRRQLNERQRRVDVGPSESGWRPLAVRTVRSSVGVAPCVPGTMARRSKNRRGVNALDPHMGDANEFSIQHCNTNCALPAIGRCCNAT